LNIADPFFILCKSSTFTQKYGWHMKIISIGSQFFNRAFRAAGIDVLAVVPIKMISHPSDIPFDFYGRVHDCESFIARLIDTFKPDLIYQGDHSGPLIHCGLENYDIPKVWFAVDVHLHNTWYPHFSPVFDKVFCAQQNHIMEMSRYTSDVEWLPLCYTGEVCRFTSWNRREFEVSFVGTLDNDKNPSRVNFFKQLKEYGLNVTIVQGQFEHVYNNSKIVINQSVKDDLNLRFFEATACGALLLTDRLSHSMDDILIPGEDFLLYEHDNINSVIEQVQWVRNNPVLAEKMAYSAFVKIHQNHLEIHRALTITEWYSRFGKISHNKNHDEMLSHLAWTFDLCSQLSIPENVTDFFKQRSSEIVSNLFNKQILSDRVKLLTAERCLAEGMYHRMNDLLMQTREIDNDPIFNKRLAVATISVLIITGKKETAAIRLQTLISKYPDDPDIKKIEQLLLKM
jgi:Glycosyl transferases group 1